MEKTNQLCFSNSKPATTDHGRNYHYRSLKLSQITGIPNVITRAGKDNILIGTENGRVLLINLKSNRLKAYLEVDPWLTSVVCHRSEVWSVGLKRELTATSLRSQRKVASFQLQPSKEKYSPNGVQLKPTKAANFYLHNSGGLNFTVISLQTKKPIRRFNLEHHLSGLPGFAKFRPADKTARCLCVSTKSSLLFFVLNRKDPHFVIFDYRTTSVLKFEPLLAPIDREMYNPVTEILLMGSTDEFIISVIQMRRKETGLLMTWFTVFKNEPNKAIFEVVWRRTAPSTFGSYLVQLDQIYSASFKDLRNLKPGHLYFFFGMHSGKMNFFCYHTQVNEVFTAESALKIDGRSQNLPSCSYL